MTKKIVPKIIISLICLLCFYVISFVLLKFQFKENASALYKKYQYPNEEFYGKDLYSEIDYKCTAYETEIGNQIISRAYEVAHYTGTEQNSLTELGNVGALSKYFYFYEKDAVVQEAEFDLITCKIEGNNGRVWVETTLLRNDKNGENAGGGGRNMLSLWHIEFYENEWHVMECLDSP